MKNKKRISKKTSVVLAILLTIFSCKTEKKAESKELVKQNDPVIEIVTESMDFQMVDTISSDWHTFKYVNKSPDTHFFLFDKYPEGKSIKDTEHEVGPPFQKGMDLINEGKPEEAFAAFGELPAWFSEIVFTGGSGLVSPGVSNEITVNLEPGYYVVECYVKMPNGVFHTSMGMVKELIVTDEVSQKKIPEANVNIEISSTGGITFSDTVKKGKNVFSVHYLDQLPHENFVGHDVHLVKLADNADHTILESWMNWATPKGLISPAPEGFTFLGGLSEMPAGRTGYFSTSIDSGTYAFVAEVPNAIQKNMFQTFIIP